MIKQVAMADSWHAEARTVNPLNGEVSDTPNFYERETAMRMLVSNEPEWTSSAGAINTI